MLYEVITVQGHIDGLEGHVDEIPHCFRAVGGKHEGVRRVGLKHTPHTFNIVLCKPPVTLGVHVAKFEHVELAELDFSGSYNFV